MKKLKGIVCANITPMTATGEVDLASLERLVGQIGRAHV